MGYEIDNIKLSQSIFFFLLQKKELSEQLDSILYKSYVENDEVMNLVKSQGDIARCKIERFGNVIYLIPLEDNTFLGYSKAQLKQEMCKSGATDKDYYLSQFIIITLLTEFYDGQGSRCKSRDYIKAGELLNIVTETLKRGVDLEQNQKLEDNKVEADRVKGFAFVNMAEAYESLKSSDGITKSRTYKEGFLFHILKFLESQELIIYIQEDEMIKTTIKLDNFMEWNILNRANYDRVASVLGVL